MSIRNGVSFATVGRNMPTSWLGAAPGAVVRPTGFRGVLPGAGVTIDNQWRSGLPLGMSIFPGRAISPQELLARGTCAKVLQTARVKFSGEDAGEKLSFAEIQVRRPGAIKFDPRPARKIGVLKVTGSESTALSGEVLYEIGGLRRLAGLEFSGCQFQTWDEFRGFLYGLRNPNSPSGIVQTIFDNCLVNQIIPLDDFINLFFPNFLLPFNRKSTLAFHDCTFRVGLDYKWAAVSVNGYLRPYLHNRQNKESVQLAKNPSDIRMQTLSYFENLSE